MMYLFFSNLNLFLFAATGDPCNNVKSDGFFGFPHWWKYLDKQYDPLGQCAPVVDFAHHPASLWLIGLAVLDMLLRLAGFVAVVSIIIAGVQLITSEGNPEKASSGRDRLINSLLGLGIAAIATILVSFIGKSVASPAGGNGLPNAPANQAALNDIFNIAFVVFGALAFLYIVIAGFRFVASRGEPAKVAEARRQIIYGALGLAIIGAASAIVNFVLNRL